MKSPKEYFECFTIELSVLTDDEIIHRFNHSIGIKAFGIARQGYLSALRNQLEERGIDFREVGDKSVMSYANKVDLVRNKMIKRGSSKK